MVNQKLKEVNSSLQPTDDGDDALQDTAGVTFSSMAAALSKDDFANDEYAQQLVALLGKVAQPEVRLALCVVAVYAAHGGGEGEADQEGGAPTALLNFLSFTENDNGGTFKSAHRVFRRRREWLSTAWPPPPKGLRTA